MSRQSRLARLVRVRELLERHAQAELAQRQAATTRAQDDRAARTRSHADRPRPAGRMPATLLRALQLGGMRSQELVDAAAAAHAEAMARQTEANDARSAASTRRRATERLRERRQAEDDQLAQAAAQRTLDELAALRWAARP